MIEKNSSNAQRLGKSVVKTNGRKVATLILNLVSACLVTFQIIGAFGIAVVNDTNATIGQFLLFWVKK